MESSNDQREELQRAYKKLVDETLKVEAVDFCLTIKMGRYTSNVLYHAMNYICELLPVATIHQEQPFLHRKCWFHVKVTFDKDIYPRELEKRLKLLRLIPFCEINAFYYALDNEQAVFFEVRDTHCRYNQKAWRYLRKVYEQQLK